MSESKFDQWFLAQFGPRSKAMFLSDEQLSLFIKNGTEHWQELQSRQRWDDMRRAALYAWNVEEKSK